MLNTQSNFAKLFALSSLSLLLAACGGGGGSDNSTGGGTTTPPVTNTDLFTVKAKEWKIEPTVNTSYCYDIDTQTPITCEGSDWDVKFAMGTRTPALFTNSGVSGSGTGGALYSPFNATWENLIKEKDATQGGSLPAAVWIADSYSNAFMDSQNGFNSFFEYDLFGDHRMSPNFKTFLVTTDTTKTATIGTAEKPIFALQISDYYKGTASGNITVRYINTLTPDADVKVLSVDATQGWAYVDLKTGTVSNSKDSNWQIAFNRYSVQLNTGIGSQVASQPAGFYTTEGKAIVEKFKDVNAVTATLADLKTASSAKVTKWGSNTITSVLNPVYQGAYPNKLSYGWYSYYPTIESAQADGLQAAHSLGANQNAATMLRGNKGNSYARMHLKTIAYADPSNSGSATTWTFEFDVQPAQ